MNQLVSMGAANRGAGREPRCGLPLGASGHGPDNLRLCAYKALPALDAVGRPR